MLPIHNLNILMIEEEDHLEEIRIYNAERRELRDACNPFDVSDTLFKQLYRLTKDMAHYVYMRIEDRLDVTENIRAVPPVLKFFAALYFYATGSYQRTVGRMVDCYMAQQTISRCIYEVSNALIGTLGDEMIRFPRTNAEKNECKRKFWEAVHFPGVLGAIDCSHIAIIAPKDQEHNYINRKLFHSKNVQIICDYDLKILNINPRHAGSTHDALIWRQSAIKREMQRIYGAGDRNTWLLGDAGYPQEPWLMTPINNALPGTPEANYTRTHIEARNCVERCIGVLKGRFRCINNERVLRYDPVRAGHIVNACAILHNICVNGQLEIDFNIDYEPQDGNRYDGLINNQGAIARRNLIQRYFV